MKKSTSFFLAIVSTMLLAVGAARAADRLDRHTDENAPLTGKIMDGPALPCGTVEEI